MDGVGPIIRGRAVLTLVLIPTVLLYLRFAMDFSWAAVGLVAMILIVPIVAARVAVRLLEEPPRRRDRDEPDTF